MIHMKSLTAQTTTALRLRARQLALLTPHRSSTPSLCNAKHLIITRAGWIRPAGVEPIYPRLVDLPLVNMRMITIRRPIFSGGTWQARRVGRVPPCNTVAAVRACLVAPMRPQLAVKQGPMTAMFCLTLPKACGLQSVRLREIRYRRTALRRLSGCWAPRRQCVGPIQPTGVTGRNQEVCSMGHDDCYYTLYLTRWTSESLRSTAPLESIVPLF
ncbi:hypothetical protein EDB87DRAFT_1314457 [Lactarius vividus]|nr:hypothetical protein EDB87DRAFT_1314457 [Lactarius vividus]